MTAQSDPAAEAFEAWFTGKFGEYANQAEYRWAREGFDFARASVERAVAAETERCAKIAENPYSDQVEAYGTDEPSAVGAKIAAAIRSRSAPGEGT